MIRSPRAVRVLIALGVVATVAVVHGDPAVEAQSAPAEPLEIFGSGDDVAQLVGERFANALLTSKAGVLLTFQPQGGRDGRGSWARGQNDFAVTGRPRTAADDAELAKRGTSAIEAPIAVSAMSLVYVPRDRAPLTFVVPGATEDDPLTITPFTPPLKMPAATAAGSFIGTSPKLNADPLVQAVYPGLMLSEQLTPTIGVSRSDPSAFMYYLQQYISGALPTEFTAAVQRAGTPFTPPAESWFASGYRSGDAALATVAQTGQSPGSGADGVPLLVPLTPARANQLIADQLTRADPTSMYSVALQNGLGEWVQPTTESISRSAAGSVAAGGAESPSPLWGLSQATPDVQGAWPLTWISSIEVQSSGLPVDKTNAIATLMRYSASDAAAADATALGEGVLPVPLRLKALAAADLVVAGNCTGAGRAVRVAADGGPYWPANLGVPAGGVKICVDTTPTATTTIPTTTGAPVVSSPVAAQSDPSNGAVESSSSFRSGSSDTGKDFSEGSLSAVDPDDLSGGDGNGEVAGPASPGAPTPASISPVAATLPLGMPDDGRKTLDRLTTMLMGGVAFLLLRGAIRKRGVAT